MHLFWLVYGRAWWLWHDFRRAFWPHRVYASYTMATRIGDPNAVISIRVIE
jgi:hypothetical protein